MRAALLFLALGLSACNCSTPTAPTPPPAPPVSPLPSPILSISLIGDMWIPITSSGVQMTARLVTSTTPFEWVDGNDRVTWTVEPAGVVSVDRQGRVTPVSNGIATVVATLGDQRGTNRVRVLPDYAGTWSGTYRITGCSGHYDFRTCGRMMFNQLDGSRNGYPFTLVLTQFRDQVTGTLDERSRSIPITGIVRESGVLVLEATVAQPDLDPVRITNWASTTNAGNTLLSGAFTKFELGRIGTTPYTVRTENEFVDVSHVK